MTTSTSTNQAALSSTLAWTTYTDAEYFRSEIPQIFRGAWPYVGAHEAIADPGDQRARRALDVPVLLVRDEDGTARAFVNTCRHRGARLVEDSVCARSIQCPYHAWTYRLDGSLRAAPRFL